MMSDASLFVIFCALVIALGWFIIHRKRQQQKEQSMPESLMCPDCGLELKLVNGGSQDIYKCNCSNLYQEPGDADKKEQ